MPQKDLFKVDVDDLSWVASTARAVTGLDARRRPGSNAKQALQGQMPQDAVAALSRRAHPRPDEALVPRFEDF